MTYEGLRLKILAYKRKIFSKFQSKKIKNKEFTIISNNCWGGMIYESYNLKKQSPTIGLYFFADDYILFLKNLEKNLKKAIIFIKPEESKWYEYMKNDKKFGSYPIGKIDDIEIFFLHYHSEKEALEKWNRRCKRINWNNLIIKFNDQNGCDEKNVEEFFQLPYENKLFFSVKDWTTKNKYYKIKQPFEKKYIKASYEPFWNSKYINITQYLNEVISKKNI